MRNLSLEAAKMAEEALIARDSRLADKIYRQNLSPQKKEELFFLLYQIATLIEMQLIEDTQYGRQ